MNRRNEYMINDNNNYMTTQPSSSPTTERRLIELKEPLV